MKRENGMFTRIVEMEARRSCNNSHGTAMSREKGIKALIRLGGQLPVDTGFPEGVVMNRMEVLL